MKSYIRPVLLGSALLFAPVVLNAETTPAPAVAGAFSVQQLADGLKAGLGSILTQSLAGNAVTVTPPPALAKIQAALGKTDKGATASGFGDAFKAVVAQVAPQAGGLFQGALKDAKIEDAQAVLSGGSDAGTRFLQNAVGPAVREKLLPLVKQATASSGLAAKAKDMLALAGPLAGLGGNKAMNDLDGYLTDQVLAQSFALIAKQEAAVRANPSLITGSPLAQKVFAQFKAK